MKKAIILAVSAFVLSASATFATGKEEVRETRNVKDFTQIGFGISGNLYVNIGSEFKVELEGEKSVLDDIETVVNGSRLVIRKDNWRLNMNEKVDVYITMPRLEGLGVSGSGRAEIRDAVKGSKLSLSVSGSGKLYPAEIDVTDLECSISGSGDIIANKKGKAGSADISISGSGGYSGELLAIDKADVSISGSGNCSCSVTGSLNARVSGSGNVTYSGNPRVDARVSGSGKVRSR